MPVGAFEKPISESRVTTPDKERRRKNENYQALHEFGIELSPAKSRSA